MSKAWIGGAAAPLSEAVTAAARLMAASRLPLVTGLATDVAGVRGALNLARVAGGVIDHGRSETLYRNLDVLRGSGLFLGAPAEMRRRADRFLIVGGDAADLAPDLIAFVFGGVKDLGRTSAAGHSGRKIVWLGAPKGAGLAAKGIDIEAIACEPDDLCDAVAMIRASVAGQNFGKGPISSVAAAETAAWLKGAAFGCALWSAETLGGTGVAMLAGLVADLNAETRFSSIPLSDLGHAWGAAQLATSSSGYPLRTRFAKGMVEHDPWRFETGRLVASGECDLAVFVSALAGVAAAEPSWSGAVPVIAIVDGDPVWTHPPRVAFAAATAGTERDAILWRDEAASFVSVEAPRSAEDEPPPGAGELLEAIAGEMAPKAGAVKGRAA